MAKVNKKRQMTKGMAKGTGPIASDKALNWFRRILLAAIAVLIFYPPFLRGLYFETEQLPAMMYTLVIFGAFWVYKFLKRDKRFLETPLDYRIFTGVFHIPVCSCKRQECYGGMA